MSDPILGYTPQSSEAIAVVNANKELEEWVLRSIDKHRLSDDADQRWLAIAKTHIQEGFMAFNRAIMQPKRIDLPGDA